MIWILPSVEGQTYYDCPNAFSCRNDVITVYGPLYCQGLSSCANVTVDITNPASTAQINGRKAGMHCQQMNTREVLEVRSYMGLFNAKLVENSQDNPDTIIIGCHGEAACMFTHSMQTSETYCEGFNGCSYVNASLAHFIAHGAFSMRHSVIYSNPETQNLNGQFTGYFAGYNTTVYCLSGKVLSE